MRASDATPCGGLRCAHDRFYAGLAAGTTGGARIVTRRGEPWISVPTLERLPPPASLDALKAEVQRRWPLEHTPTESVDRGRSPSTSPAA